MTSYYDTDHEPPDPDEPTTGPQPDDFCDCRPGTQLRRPHQHEQWRPAVGWEGAYEVSDHGRVRSLWGVPVAHAAPKIRIPRLDPAGRPIVQLSRNGRRKNCRVSVLVLEAFVGPRPDGLIGCHNDGDPANNHPTNLRWDTYASNGLDAVRHGDHFWANKTHCLRGHPLEGEHLQWIRGDNGRMWRRCKTCSNRRLRDYKRLQRAARTAS